MNIDFIMDPVCPWCYIGRSRLKRALEARLEIRARVNIVPFQLNPDMPIEGMDRQTYMHLKFGSARSATAVMDGVERAARNERLAIRQDLISRTPNTRNAHRLISLAAKTGRMNPMVDCLFQAFLVEGQDIGDKAVLQGIASRLGYQEDVIGDFLDSNDGIDDIRRSEELARQMGVRGVPFFIINNRFAITGAEDLSVFDQVFDLAHTNFDNFSRESLAGPDFQPSMSDSV